MLTEKFVILLRTFWESARKGMVQKSQKSLQTSWIGIQPVQTKSNCRIGCEFHIYLVSSQLLGPLLITVWVDGRRNYREFYNFTRVVHSQNDSVLTNPPSAFLGIRQQSRWPFCSAPFHPFYVTYEKQQLVLSPRKWKLISTKTLHSMSGCMSPLA